MSDKRPNPDSLLERAREEEAQQNGKLKIYLGAAPGVGKTYSMLENARALREQGLDVVAGLVESHGRKEVDELLKSIELMPRKLVEYHNKPMLEFDLDAALKRNPGLILIDEMAHTNIPGLRHAKRWQDIKELLDRGIDVHTTLNVQHIESLNDDIARIIGIKVRETVPDSLLELADSIELVDLPPDELLRRLQEGKVYIPAQVDTATKNFFRKGNLMALRELALRATADRVDVQVLQQRRGHGIEHTWPTKERLLVCVGSTPGSARVIRAARRMADRLHADWLVVNVAAPQMHLSDEQKNNAIQNLRLAEQLGAETRLLNGLDVVDEIINFAREKNVTKIVLGKHSRPRWKDIIFGSLVDELVRLSGEVDIYIIRGDTDGPKSMKPIPAKRAVHWKSLLLAVLTPVCTTAINFLVSPVLGLINLLMIYCVGVLFVALRGHVLPALLTSLLSALAFVHFFVNPMPHWVLANSEYGFMLAVISVIAYVISHLTFVNREQSDLAHVSEERTASLHALTRQLASTRGIDKLLLIAVNHISELFSGEVLALMPEKSELKVRESSTNNKTLTAKDQGVAQWVYDIGQVAGLGTDTLPYSDSVYVPLLGAQGPVGVIKVRPKVAEKLLIPEQLRLLESCANQIALALEVDRLQEKSQKSEITMESERLRTALFGSISHELRTPLAEILRVLKHFLNMENHTQKESQDLVVQIAHETDNLNNLIHNLLQITELEEGQIKLNAEKHVLSETITTTLQRLEKKLQGHPCHVKVPPDLPLVKYDDVLIEQVLVNLLDNAIRYTSDGTDIDISVAIEDNSVLVSVADHGPGLVIDDLDMIFEKFYRGKGSAESLGAGLGLSVCQSIIKAHGGRIWAENRWGGGAIFYFLLPFNH